MMMAAGAATTPGRFNPYNTLTETTPKLFSLKFNHLDELERDYSSAGIWDTGYYVNLNFKLVRGVTFNPMFQYEDIRRDMSAYSGSWGAIPCAGCTMYTPPTTDHLEIPRIPTCCLLVESWPLPRKRAQIILPARN